MSEYSARDDMSAICDSPHPAPKNVWFIWQKRGHPPRFAWTTEEAAITEAQRLAKRHPGVSFLVMHVTHKLRVELPEPAGEPS